MLTHYMALSALGLISSLELQLPHTPQYIHGALEQLLMLKALPNLESLALPNGLHFKPDALCTCTALASLQLRPMKGYICGVTYPDKWAVGLASLSQLTHLAIGLETIPWDWAAFGKLVSLCVEGHEGIHNLVFVTGLTALTWVATQYTQGVYNPALLCGSIPRFRHLARLSIPNVELSYVDIACVSSKFSLTALNIIIPATYDWKVLAAFRHLTCLFLEQRSVTLQGTNHDKNSGNVKQFAFGRLGLFSALCGRERRKLYLLLDLRLHKYELGVNAVSKISDLGSLSGLLRLDIVFPPTARFQHFFGDGLKTLTRLTVLCCTGKRFEAGDMGTLAALPRLRKLGLQECRRDDGTYLAVDSFAPLADHLELAMVALQGTSVLKCASGAELEKDPKEIQNVLGAARRARGWPPPRVLMEGSFSQETWNCDGWDPSREMREVSDVGPERGRTLHLLKLDIDKVSKCKVPMPRWAPWNFAFTNLINIQF